MKSRVLATFAVVLLTTTAVWAAKYQPIQNIVDEPVPILPDGSARNADAVRAAIIAGCTLRTWTPVVSGDNELTCSILVRGRHYAEVRIPYSGENYSILYSSSRELNYDAEKQKIHRNYNKWIFNLSNAIKIQFIQ
jgi:hypothetical protein